MARNSGEKVRPQIGSHGITKVKYAIANTLPQHQGKCMQTNANIWIWICIFNSPTASKCSRPDRILTKCSARPNKTCSIIALNVCKIIRSVLWTELWLIIEEEKKNHPGMEWMRWTAIIADWLLHIQLWIFVCCYFIVLSIFHFPEWASWECELWSSVWNSIT